MTLYEFHGNKNAVSFQTVHNVNIFKLRIQPLQDSGRGLLQATECPVLVTLACHGHNFLK